MKVSVRARVAEGVVTRSIELVGESLARAGRLLPWADPTRHGVEVISNITYSPLGLGLDVYRPMARTAALTPTVLHVHGGGFGILSKDTHWVAGLLFARAGYTVFNIDYRLAPRHPFPAALIDTIDAYHWVLAHAEGYGADPHELILAGESAGANLITALTLCVAERREEPYAARAFAAGVMPRGIVPTCGILQVSDPGRFVRSGVARSPMVRTRLNAVARAYLDPQLAASAQALADPLCILEERERAFERALPPVFIGVGTADPIVEDSRRLAKAWQKHQSVVEAREYAGEGHAFHLMVWKARARRYWDELLTFLDGSAVFENHRP